MKVQFLKITLFMLLGSLFTHKTNAQTLISSFQFNNNLTDDLGNGVCTAVSPSNTSYNNGTLNWTEAGVSQQNGLSISLPDGLFTEGDFSIAIQFSFSETSGYRKLVDFKNFSSDQGAYVNTNLRLYSIGDYGSVDIVPDTVMTCLLTRNSSDDSVKFYLVEAGGLLLESAGLDLNDDFISDLNLGERVIHFFQDDQTTSSEYSPNGSVNFIYIWNGVVDYVDVTTVGIKEEIETSEFVCFPNPATSNLTVQFPKETSGQIEIIDVQGRVVYQVNVSNALAQDLNVSALQSGIYVLTVNGKSQRFVKK